MKPSRIFVAGITLSVFAVLAIAVPAAAQSWTQLTPTGGPPPQRWQHTATSDATTNVMIVFGGENSAGGAGGPCVGTTCYNDVWVLSNADGLGGTPLWIQLTPSGTAPSPRSASRAVYDPSSNRMVVYGGGSNATPPYFGGCTGQFNDVWVLSNANGSGGTPAWTQLSVAGGPPIARQLHSEVYDGSSNRMIVFGGVGVCGSLADLWVLSNANGLGGTPTWTQLSPVGPTPTNRYLSDAVFDSGNNRMIIFGGVGCPTVVPPGPGQCSPSTINQVWVLANANGLGGSPAWTQLTPTGGPPSPRAGAVVVYNPTSNAMVIFGGSDEAGNIFSDVWRLSNANGLGGAPNWTQLTPAGGPGPRTVFAGSYQQTTDRMTIFGGLATLPPSSPLNDTWVLTQATGVVLNQSPAANAGPDLTVIVGESAQFDGSASYDPDGTITNFHWDFDGNGTADGAIVNRVFSSAGQFTVTLTVTDNQSAIGSDTMVVTVLSTTGAIQNLTQIVQSFNLQQGITNALDSKLQNIQDALSADNSGARQDALNKLQAFINSVEAQRGNKLTGVQADALVLMARRIMAVI